jgi:ankyrin repeat protein
MVLRGVDDVHLNNRSSSVRTLAAAVAIGVLLIGCGAEAPEQPVFRPGDAGESAGSLLDVVRGGRTEAVRALLEQGADANETEADGTTALLQAVGTRSPELVELLLNAGADVASVNRYGMSALHLAARNADARMVRALLDAGADPSIALPEGETVLMAAARSGNAEVVAALLAGRQVPRSGDYGSAAVVLNAADPNQIESWHGQTALMWATAGGHVEVMRLLIDAGADIDQASSRIDAPEVATERRQGGFVYAEIPEGRLTALHFAARQGELEAVEALIAAGADLNVADNYGTTPVVLATLNGHLGVAAALLEAGADPNIQDRYGRTVLFVATDLNTLDVNPRPPPPITGGYTPVDIVRLVLERGAQVDLAISDEGLPAWVAQGGAHNPALGGGATALFRAAMSGDLEIMNLLLAAGADPNIVTKEQPCRMPGAACEYTNMLRPDGQTTPFMAAAGVAWRLGISRGREADAIEAMRILLERGADINHKNQAGHTALHGAAYRQAPRIAEFLVENGADLTATNERGWTALDIAMGQPDFRIPADEEVAEVLRNFMKAR